MDVPSRILRASAHLDQDSLTQGGAGTGAIPPRPDGRGFPRRLMKTAQRGSSMAIEALFLLAIMLVAVFAIHEYQSRPASHREVAQLVDLVKRVPLRDVSPEDQRDLVRVITHKAITWRQARNVKADLLAIIRKRHDNRVMTRFLATHKSPAAPSRS